MRWYICPKCGNDTVLDEDVEKCYHCGWEQRIYEGEDHGV